MSISAYDVALYSSDVYMYPYVISCLNYCTPMAMQWHLISKLGKNVACRHVSSWWSNTLNQFLFACEKSSWDLQEPLCHKYIFAANLSLLYRCYINISIKTSVGKVWSRKIVVVNQFISSKSLNKVVANKNYDVN